MIGAKWRARVLIGVALGLQAVAAQGADGPYPEASRAGVIDAVDLPGSGMIVSGYRYEVAIDTRVEIGGSYGAFSMLRPGMRVRFDYLVISPTERRMLLIQELPAHVKLEET